MAAAPISIQRNQYIGAMQGPPQVDQYGNPIPPPQQAAPQPYQQYMTAPQSGPGGDPNLAGYQDPTQAPAQAPPMQQPPQQGPPAFDYSSYLAQNALNPAGAPPPYDPYGSPANNPYGGLGPQNWSNQDPNIQATQNRLVGLQTGGALGQGLGASANYYGDQSQYYRDAMNAGYAGLAQQPGYSPAEAAAITRQDQLYAGMTTPGGYASLAPTASETAGISGNPQSLYKFYDPTQLDQSGQYQGDVSSFAKKYEMTPAEQQDIIASTSADLATQRAAEEGQISRSAAAAGVGQLGVAAAQNRAEVQGTAAAGDALTNARIAASNAAAARYAGIMGVQTQAEQQRIGAQQYAQSMGTGIATTADELAAQRASQLYGIRQGNTQYAQQSQFGQNLATQQQLSSTNANVAGARIAGQNNYLNFLTGQTGQTMGAQQTEQGLQQQNYGNLTGAINSPAATKAGYDTSQSGQSFGAQVTKGFGGFIGNLRKGGLVKRVRTALIGEAGPEAVIPIRGDDAGEQEQLNQYRRAMAA